MTTPSLLVLCLVLLWIIILHQIISMFSFNQRNISNALFVAMIVSSLLVFTCIGCAPVRKNVLPNIVYNNKVICEFPVQVVIDPDIPYWQAAFIWTGFDYWNYETGMNLFYWTTNPNHNKKNPIIIVSIKPENIFTTDALGTYSSVLKTNSKCLIFGKIEINKGIVLFPVHMETVVRHEAGHVLGLSHSRYIGIMKERLKISRTDVPEFAQDASEDEIQAVKKLYPQAGKRF